MAAPKKNEFWKFRTKSGRDKLFSSPDELLTAAEEYFDHCTKNPLYEQKVLSNGKKVTLPLMRAFTLTGLLLFLDIDENTWQRYRKETAYKDFWAVIKRIDNIIYTQKFEGAAAGLFNPNIIARDLGLAEKSQIAGEGGGPVQHIVTHRVVFEN